MKKLLVILGVCLLAFAFAGADLFAAEGHGLNPYRTPEFVRNPAQMANAVDPLAIAVYNPAGFTKLQDGIYVGLGNIYILKENEMVTAGGTYKADEPSPLIPTFAFAWKQGKGALFLNYEVIDGGGKNKYKNYGEVAGVSQGYTVDLYSSWTQAKIGASFELMDMLSVTGGIRYIMGKKSIKLTANANGATAKDYEYEYTGQAGFFGINLAPTKEALINVTYFTKAYVQGEVKDKVNNAKQYASDIVPSYLTVGLSYAVMPELTVSAGVNYIFTKEEKYGDATGGETKYFEKQKNAVEYAIGADYKANEQLTLSAGWAYKKAGGCSENYQTDGTSGITKQAEMWNPDLDLQILGAGAKITAMPGLNINAGIMKAFFKDGKNVAGTTTYKRDAWLFGLGVDYKI